MPRITINPSALFVRRVEEYAARRGGISISRAVNELAHIALAALDDGTIELDPAMFSSIPPHGGKRPGAGRPKHNAN